jgi:hypothetical protein
MKILPGPARRAVEDLAIPCCRLEAQVRCPSGRRTWRATVTIPDVSQADFIFDAIY